MALATREQFELDLETAHGQVMSGFLNPSVSEDTKLVAAAITLAGTQIALAIANGPDWRSNEAAG